MRITHARVALELHELARRQGPALLLLHALFGSSDDWGEAPAVWPGSVYALDFSGHGRSEWVGGGVYSPEYLAGDADAALAQLGRAAIAGAGLGAYVALLLAGARAAVVPATLLLPGAGLDGGGTWPDFMQEFPTVDTPLRGEPSGDRHDPMVRTLGRDVRPVDYAEAFGRAAHRLLLAEDGAPRPPWWETVRGTPSAQPVPADLRQALPCLAAAAR